MDTQIKLRVSEIFYSLQGETSTVGLPTTFIRLTGCPLRCQYCDTTYAFSGGKLMELSAIMQEIKTHNSLYVTVTGGEPLAQKNCILLLATLCDAGFKVSLETSGAFDISAVDTRVSRIVDIKTPGSKEVAKNAWNNIPFLTPHDQIKFVICDKADYEWAKQIINDYHLPQYCPILFSASYTQLRPGDLADWILEDRLPVRMQIQLHKILWGDVPGR